MLNNIQYKELQGFSGNIYHFVKIAEVYLDDIPLQAIFNNKSLKDWRLKLRLLVTDKILEAEQSCYLVYDEDFLIYVGYYSGSFKDRWWLKKGYFWHSCKLDDTINKLLKNNPSKSITVWISIDPYAIRDNKKVNISKFIEDDIIMAISEKEDGNFLNKQGKKLKFQQKETKAVSQILEISSNIQIK